MIGDIASRFAPSVPNFSWMYNVPDVINGSNLYGSHTVKSVNQNRPPSVILKIVENNILDGSQLDSVGPNPKIPNPEHPSLTCPYKTGRDERRMERSEHPSSMYIQRGPKCRAEDASIRVLLHIQYSERPGGLSRGCKLKDRKSSPEL